MGGIDMHIHILGICGTFMAGIASLARSLGFTVTGCDSNIYPPMSDYLKNLGIDIIQGFEEEQLDFIKKDNKYPDQIIVGNIVKRGMPVIERVLREKISYTSGPNWLSDNLLKNKIVLAVAGTHGKTSTASMLAWILTDLGLDPGYLIGGLPKNLDHPVALGSDPYFVIEADEYDTAFFDKRAKFVHYSPNIFIINNLEFDHADIYSDLDAIKKQMHHGVRLVPDDGLIIAPDKSDEKFGENIADVLVKGCWSEVQNFRLINNNNNNNNNNWCIKAIKQDCSEFEIYNNNKQVAIGSWDIIGDHNLHNALAAVITACNIKDKNNNKIINPQDAVNSLSNFKGVRRRCECIYSSKNIGANIGDNIKIYDDFAHHPTAIYETLLGLRNKVNKGDRIIALLEPRSNTMKMNLHKDNLVDSLRLADFIYLYTPKDLAWDSSNLLNNLDNIKHFDEIDLMLDDVLLARKNYINNNCVSHYVIMSNGGFEGVHEKFINLLD